MSKNDREEGEDPYANLANEKKNRFEGPTKESARDRKMKLLSGKLNQFKEQAKQGFIIGSMVGGGMGAVFGLWSAITNRSLIILPISIVVSGASFGFILACGSIIRSQEDAEVYFGAKSNLWLNKYSHETGELTSTEQPYWVTKVSYLNSLTS
jgi:hypothetical protein